MHTVTQASVTAADRPLPPHPSTYLSPERLAEWYADLEEQAALRGLPPVHWPA